MAANLVQTTSDWRAQIKALQSLLEELHPKLIEAEARLADKMARISAFEFKLRTAIGPLVTRLEGLQAEIQALKKQLRQMQEAWFFAQNEDEMGDWDPAEWQLGPDASATAEGNYRYMGPQVQPPPQELSQDTQETIKKLYRQLARRFHPDLADNDADRAYHTEMMMRINAAYTTGDLEQLEMIAAEPDSVSHLDAAQTEQQLAEALMREVERCQRRLAEIEQELTRLALHRNARLLDRAERTTARGGDFLRATAVELQEIIAQKLVQRDVLQQQLENFDEEESGFATDDFADTIFDLRLEQVFEDNPDIEAESWSWRRRDRSFYDDEEDYIDEQDY